MMNIFNQMVRQQLLKNELECDEKCMWLSFVDPEKPKAEQFIGVIITMAYGIISAVDKTHGLGINPGGEVLGCETDQNEIYPSHFDVLLSKQKLIEYGYHEE